ncbi:MAG: peptide ABC transporter substrate-binding protein [Candidatus Eremiobacteraeota bacterium]|nr:peptide ABC transporter substrate-binding protein [Candidatus Eremiobacteraeota bacterium]
MPKNLRLAKHNTGNPFGATLGALGAAAALAALLSACAGPSGQRAVGRTVRFDVAADPRTLNPLLAAPDAASVEQQLARLAFEPFLDLDDRGRPQPELLAVIPSRANGGLSADGCTIRYRLRRGVLWSDGRPVTSADALFTLHAILDPRNAVRSHEGYDLIDRARALGPYEFVVHLKHAWAPAVMTYFSYGFTPLFVVPAHVLSAQTPLDRAAFNAAPTVGDGPYRFVSWRRGEDLRYDANSRYWRGKPQPGSLLIRTIPDPSTNLLLLQTGELDWNLVAPAQIRIVRRYSGIKFRNVPTAVVAGLALNTSHAPLDDVRVRRALAMSIDRATISQKITLGVYPVTDMIQPRFSWAYDPSVHEPSYDPVAADRLFDAAGWRRDAGGLRHRGTAALRLVYVQFPESVTGVRVAAAVQAELRQRGVDVVIKAVSNAQLFLPRTGVLASGAFDLAYVPWTMGADPDDSSVLGCGAPSNYMRWCDLDVQRLERAALSSNDPAARKRFYGRIARLVAEQVPILFLFNAHYVYAYQTRLEHFAPNALLPTWNAYRWRLRGR